MRKSPVLAIFCIVLGAVASLRSLAGLVSMALTRPLLSRVSESLPQAPGQPDGAELMSRAAEVNERLRPYHLALYGALLALSIAIAVIGAGIARSRAWARTAALAWGILALAYVAAMAWVQLTVISPAASAAYPPNAAVSAEAVQRFSRFVAVASCLVYLPFPVVLLVLVGRRPAGDDTPRA